MGHTFSNTVTQTQSEFLTNTVNRNQSACASLTNQSLDNNTIIITGDVGGNVNLGTESASTDSTCIITSDMETNVFNIVGNISLSTNDSSGLFGNLGFHTSRNIQDTYTKEVTNTIQSNQTLCGAASIQSVDDNFVYIKGNVDGDVDITVGPGSASSSCVMNNYMKAATYNSVQTSNTTDNESKKGPIATLISGAIGLFILLIIGAVILITISILGFGAFAIFKGITGKGAPPKTPGSPAGGDKSATEAKDATEAKGEGAAPTEVSAKDVPAGEAAK